ncbi:carbohydrate ABC transporter permease [Clostridium senegalense]|uniref:carbohydrate ABC transporter permease n=2 Tax=Clostridium senegalense TaxID=1465809 RepID=UPI001C107FE4|nr:sugar ABC transporter permease [Clostridium senegalense]MBU5226776.1 sugar ABC transporter permease [Clostridium senegalense]
MNNNRNLKSFFKGLLYISPVLIILIVFNIYPILKTFDMSFYSKYNYQKNLVFERGIDNYIYLLNDDDFFIAIKNTFIYASLVMPISIILSLSIAILLNSNIKLKGFFRSIYFLPFVTSSIAISMVWRWIFHGDHGLLNYLLSVFNIDPINWLSDPSKSMISLIIVSVWRNLGYNIIIFLSGLQSIDEKYNIVARIDGANFFQRVKNITIPLLSPTLFFVCIITCINSFKVFGEVFALFDKQPGPLNSCLTMVYYIYNKFYNHYQYGIASAAALILFLIIVILNTIQFKIGRKKVNYD